MGVHISKEDQPSLSNIPDDVLCNNILIRLPAKLVAQARCVSKQWNALLSRPSFIKSHLDLSLHNKDEETLMVFSGGFSFRDKPFTVHRSRSPHHQLTSFIKLPVNVPSSKDTCCWFIGSVNGLVCVCFVNHEHLIFDINIWNPSLSTLLPLPVPPSTLTPNSSDDDYPALLQFGYDPKTDDYKVVKVTGCLSGDIAYMFYSCVFFFESWLRVVEVYSLRKGCWESISQSFPSHIKGIHQDEVYVNGHVGNIHWLCCIDEEMTQETIVAFDLSTETFNEISLPASMQRYDRSRSLILGYMAGKICLTSRFRNGMCEVWVMDEYKVAESWVIHHVFPQSFGIVRPFGFTKNNEFLYEADDRSLALYDPVTAEVKSFRMRLPPRESLDYPILNDRIKVIPYVESLVWIAPGGRAKVKRATGLGIAKIGASIAVASIAYVIFLLVTALY